MGKKTFEDFKGETRDDVLSLSSDEFFDDMIKQIRCRIEDWISNSEYYY